MKKILFITHETTRTGAPFLLLYFLKWLNQHHKNIESTLLSIKKGELSDEFSAVVSNTYELSDVIIDANKVKHSFIQRVKRKLFPNIKNKNAEATFFKKLSDTKWDLIFSNTIVNGKHLETLYRKEIPIISYIHELNYIIKEFERFDNVKGTLKYSNFFLCGSMLVQDNLIKNYNIKPLNSAVVHSFLKFQTKVKDVLISKKIKMDLMIPEDALVVAMMGSYVWRKGTDFFIDTARKLKTENIYFLWIGANRESINQLQFDLAKSSTKLNVVLIPPSQDYQKYFNCIDLFYLSSREDPYPMVMVEATSYGIPIICFNGAGGTQEFIDNKTGFIIPYGDTTKVAETIKLCNENRKLLYDNSEYIKEKSLGTHNVDVNASQIFEVMKSLMEEST